MSDYLRIPHLFEAQIDRGVLHHRSPRLNQLVSAIDVYIHMTHNPRFAGECKQAVQNVSDNLEKWRIQDPKEFADRSVHGFHRCWIDDFMSELTEAAHHYGAHLQNNGEPRETNYEFSPPPIAVENRHRNEPYWAAEHFRDVLWPEWTNRHSSVKSAGLAAMGGINQGVGVAQTALGQASLAGIAIGGAVTSATGVGLIATSAVLALVQSGLAVHSWQKTFKHLQALRHLQEHRNDQHFSLCQVRAGGGELRSQAHTLVADNILQYIILQKSEKLTRKSVSTVPVLGSAITSLVVGTRNVASRLRGTLGVNRYKAAHWLAAHFCECECLLTDCIVGSLYSMEEMIALHRLYGYEETADLVAVKMKSI